MKKFLIILCLGLLLILNTNAADATLWNYFNGDLPSLEYRAKIYKNIASDAYRGSYSQNIALEAFLRATGPNLTLTDKFGAKAFRPSGYSTSLSSQLAEQGSETTLIVNSLDLPDGTTLNDSYYGSLLILTVGEGDSEEKIAVSTLDETNKTFTIVSRGLEYGRWASSTSNMAQHLPGEVVYVSNDDHWMYNLIPDLETAETIAGQKTFTLSPIVPTPGSSDLTYAANVEYVNDVATSGAANASETVKGLVELANKTEAGAGTSAGATGARLVLPASLATNTPSANISIPVTDSSGKLSQSFLDLTNNWTFSSTTLSSTGTSTFNGFTIFNGNSYGAGFTHNYIATTSHNWSVPTNVTKIKVRVVGGGGGGGNSVGSGVYGGTGGGGGGGYCEKIINVSATTSIGIIIGIGGATNVNGSTTYFSSYCNATGGSKGSNNQDGGYYGGAGGCGSGGDLNSCGSGGGTGSRADNFYTGGNGGSSIFGGGANGIGMVAAGSAINHGTSASNYGGGGSGCIDADGGSPGTGCTGGSGSNGIVIIEY